MAKIFAWRLAAAVAVAACTIDALPVLAQTRDVEPRLTVRAGAATTDNLGRQTAAAATERETFATTGVDIGVLRESIRARAWVDGTIDYYDYSSDQFSNETSGALDAGLSIRMVPEVLSWDFTDTVGHSRLDPFAPVGPGNRERINTLSTGPRASIPLGDRSSLALVSQYSDRRYEDSDSLDGPTRAASVAIAHDLSRMQRLGLSVAEREIDFDDPLSRPYEIRDSYLSYERQTSAGGSFAISAGNSGLRRVGAATQSEPYFDLAWARNVTARSTVTLRAGQGFEGPGENFGEGSLEGYEGGGVGDTLLVADPRVRGDASLSYTLSRPRATFSARHERSQEEYEGAVLTSRESSRTAAGFDYRLTQALRGTLDFSVGREESNVAADGADERYARAALVRRLGRSWNASLTFEYNRRDPDTGAAYIERRYMLSLAWSPPQRED